MPGDAGGWWLVAGGWWLVGVCVWWDSAGVGAARDSNTNQATGHWTTRWPVAVAGGPGRTGPHHPHGHTAQRDVAAAPSAQPCTRTHGVTHAPPPTPHTPPTPNTNAPALRGEARCTTRLWVFGSLASDWLLALPLQRPHIRLSTVQRNAYSMPCRANRFEPMGMTSEILGAMLPILPRDPPPM
jgi:hypothetical protein